MFDSLFKLTFCWMDILTAVGSDLASYSIFTYPFLWFVVVWLFIFLQRILHVFK